MKEDLVSIIMPTYNASKYLADSIDGILSQTYTNLELVITDDGSTERRTIEILKDYERKDPRVKVFFLDNNKGPAASRNNSIKEAKGRFLAFCDSDDVWLPQKLEKQVAFMRERNCGLSCTSYIICDDANNHVGMNVAPSTITYSMMKRDNKVGCSTAIYDTQVLGRKYYFPLLRKRQDWGLFLTIMKECRVAYGMQEPLACYRLRKGSVSRSKVSLIKYNLKVYRQVLGFSKLKSCAYFFLLFLPTYFLKMIKRKSDSEKYMRSVH